MNDAPGSWGSKENDLSGRTLGAYLLIYRLGHGGMADVYLAEQHSLQRKVAVKVLRQELAKQADYVKRFHNEARAAAALVHANIVQIYEVGCVEGIHFIAQEYVPGQTVKQLVTRRGPLPIPRVVSLMRQMAAALSKAAQGSIIHRDIKPENILLSPSGEVKVADFGLARIADPQDVAMTQAGLTMGTPLYMSPEQVEGRTLDHRSDLYSCGVTAFYMLTGRPPFEGETPLSVAVQHLQNAPPSLHQLRPDAPPELVQIVERLLAKKPADRYAGAAELLGELRTLPLAAWDHSLPIEEETLDVAGRPSGESNRMATQRLQAVIETQAFPVAAPPKRRIVVAGVLLAAIGLGGLVAELTWKGPLIDISQGSNPANERLETASDQYWHALRLNTVDAWTSVARFHPPEANATNRYFALMAQRQLAWLCLNDGQIDLAKKTYLKLTDLENDSEFRTLGHAGLTVIHFEQGETEQANKHLEQAWAERLSITGPLRQRFDKAAEHLGAA